ncbi:PREDICTED: TCM_030894 isoform [Prunus dulcis]|uniref:PREDICTED: TCM_030894 isoform n=1 Tax=Prunus dulcis TaxID=3755 RepID=A0A5E4F6H3_PRUDU|nr:PREDICTED: TCM_030894 isoform [Prunus dulcis]
MADYEPPSFSLGFDLGFDSELQTAATDHSTPAPAPDPWRGSDALKPFDVDEEIGPQITGPDPEIGPRPVRPLKRLKRGLALKREPATPIRNIDDDIEEFSSPEDIIRADAYRPTQYQTVSSSSKIPLHGSGVLTSQSSCHSMGRKRKPASDVSASVGMEANHQGLMFPKLTTSPLRRFQLIDSDSDDPSVSGNGSRVTCNVDPSSKKQHFKSGHSASTSETKKKLSVPQDGGDVDLWKDFRPIKKFSIPTPALDEVCQEFLQSAKDKTTQKLGRDSCLHTNEIFQETTCCVQDVEQLWNVADPLPPAHHYFFHDDPNIRKLVCSRLPNFFPLGINIRGNQQNGSSVIDYMGQFSNGEASKQKVNQKIHLDQSSKRRNKSNISNVEEGLHASGGWMNPKGKAAQKGSVNKSSRKGRNRSAKSNFGNVEHTSGNWVEPRSNASTKRIQANAQPSGQWSTPSASGQAAGHWYTGPGGRKVYVSKTGQEVTGSTAYRLYRKESGARSVKARKMKGKKEKGSKKR